MVETRTRVDVGRAARALLCVGVCCAACQLALEGAPCPCEAGFCCDAGGACRRDPDECAGADGDALDGGSRSARPEQNGIQVSAARKAEGGQAAWRALVVPLIDTCADLLDTEHTPGESARSSGVYRLQGASEPRDLAFCDAATGAELCAERAGEHAGVTNDESRLEFQLSSELQSDGCRVWNVRASVDHRPLDALEFYDDRGQFVSVDPCVALGFFPTLGFERSRGCPYGMNPGYGACGFDPMQDATGLMKWSNYCNGCRVHPGTSRGFVLQGEIYVSRIPWDAAGAHSVLCAVEPLSP